MANDKLQFALVTPSGTLESGSVDEVTIMTEDGEITVLPDHSPLVSTLKPGEMVLRNDGEERGLAVAGGVLEISGNMLRILADSAELPSDIDIEATEKRARELAQELEKQEQMDVNTYKQLQRSLQQEQAKLQVGKKWRKV
jgi:F-type H+-transporting ATPase subunit epsilon